MSIMVGSARHDENGRAVNGAAGDQKQVSSSNDTVGEVSMQAMYAHSKGWYILRPKNVVHANAMATIMKKACNNANIGYDQNNRLGIIKYGTGTQTKTECDCSSLVRQVVKEATGKDSGNFTTANEASALEGIGLFEKRQTYVSQSATPVYNGDVLVTKTKGHTVVVVSGNARREAGTESGGAVEPTTQTKKKVATDSAKSKDSSLAGTYKVTASALNVRNGAGTGKTAMVSIPKGTAVKCYGYYTTYKGTKWLYIQFTYEGIQYTGFASSKYLAR